jgi:acetyl esterase/lipase
VTLFVRSNSQRLVRYVVMMFLLFTTAAASHAQPEFTAETLREAAPPAGFATIKLPVDTGKYVNGDNRSEQWFWIWDQYGVRNVTEPTLTIVPPLPEKANGTSVIIAPGGGFSFLSWSNEGQPVAKYLADRGVMVFILKYRTKPTPRDNEGYAEFVRQQMRKSRNPPRRFSLAWPAATEDAAQAIRYVRMNAGRWGLQPDRIGFVGFSAGAITALEFTVAAEPANRPSFVGMIYGPMHSREIPKSPPPLFAARAVDDPLYPPIEMSMEDNFGLLGSWRASGGSVELHLFSSGGHGFGMQQNGSTSELWLDEFYKWMGSQGFLKK